jgi:hypothetical protein
MDDQKRTLTRAHRPPQRPTAFSGALLIAVLTAILTAPGASAAAELPAEAVAAEVTAAAASVAEPAAPPPSTSTPPPAQAPPPVPVPQPSSVTEPVSTVVNQLGSDSSSAASHVVREATDQGTAAVDVVAKSTGATHAPIVEDAVRRGGRAANSLVEAAAEQTKAAGTAQPSPRDRGAGERSAAPAAAGAAGQESPVGLPSPPPPQPTGDAFSWSRPLALVEIQMTTPGHAFGSPGAFGNHSAPAGVRWAGKASASTPPGDGEPKTPTVPPTPRPLAPPAEAAFSSTPGGGFGLSLFLLGVLAIFALAAPRSPPRFLSVGTRYRPTSFACALERPG